MLMSLTVVCSKGDVKLWAGTVVTSQSLTKRKWSLWPFSLRYQQRLDDFTHTTLPIRETVASREIVHGGGRRRKVCSDAKLVPKSLPCASWMEYLSHLSLSVMCSCLSRETSTAVSIDRRAGERQLSLRRRVRGLPLAGGTGRTRTKHPPSPYKMFMTYSRCAGLLRGALAMLRAIAHGSSGLQWVLDALVGEFPYINFENTSYWQLNLDGVKLSGAAGQPRRTTSWTLGANLLAGPTTDVEPTAASIKAVNTTLFPAKSTLLIAMARDSSVYTMGGDGSFYFKFGWHLLLRDVQDRRLDPLVGILGDLFMRKGYGKFHDWPENDTVLRQNFGASDLDERVG